MKKRVILLLAMVLVFSSLSAVSATSFKDTRTNFDSAWEKTIKVRGTDGYLRGTDGYNTSFINEDYIHAKDDNYLTSVKLINGNNTYTHQNIYGDSYARIDVRHAGNSVKYYANTVGLTRAVKQN